MSSFTSAGRRWHPWILADEPSGSVCRCSLCRLFCGRRNSCRYHGRAGMSNPTRNYLNHSFSFQEMKWKVALLVYKVWLILARHYLHGPCIITVTWLLANDSAALVESCATIGWNTYMYSPDKHGSYRNPRMKFNDFSMTLPWHFLGPFQVVTVE